MKPAHILMVTAALLSGCPSPRKVFPPPEPSGRCEVDLAATGLFSAVGKGAHAKVIDGSADLVSGPFSFGIAGD